MAPLTMGSFRTRTPLASISEGTAMSTVGTPRPDTSDMAAVHQVFRTSLAAAPALVASTRGNEARQALIANYYDNVLAFLDVHHHGEEVLLFSLLTERAPESRELVARMTAQHEEAVAMLEEV